MSDIKDSENTQGGEIPKKRRNRWGDAAETSATELCSTCTPATDSKPNEEDKSAADLAEDNAKKARRSRWGSAEQTTTPLDPALSQTQIPAIPIPALSEEVLQQTVVLQLQLQQINQQLITVVRDALLMEQDPNRSPSPPPKYDSNGKRTNTREVRMREKLMQQRTNIIESLIKINPLYTPPADFVKVKPFRRVYMPKHADPNFNYIGLIIGPRGNTQRQLEQDTGCKISVRGKGSAKEGSKARTAKIVDEDEELHVHIQGESDEQVEKAVKIVEAILRPIDDSLNEHKQKQLRELALINGTLREDEYCPVCGEKGHKQFDCPYRAKAFKAAGVKCSICGDLSHPTRDCPMKQDMPANESVIDSEYDNFLAELSGNDKSAGQKANTQSTGNSDGTSGPSNGGSANGAKAGQTILQPTVDIFSGKSSVSMSTTLMSSLMASASGTTSGNASSSAAESATTSTATIVAPIISLTTPWPAPAAPVAPPMPTAAVPPSHPHHMMQYPGYAYPYSMYYPGYAPAATAGMGYTYQYAADGSIIAVPMQETGFVAPPPPPPPPPPSA